MLELKSKLDISISLPLSNRFVIVNAGQTIIVRDDEITPLVKELAERNWLNLTPVVDDPKVSEYVVRYDRIKDVIGAYINLGFAAKGAMESWEKYNQ